MIKWIDNAGRLCSDQKCRTRTFGEIGFGFEVVSSRDLGRGGIGWEVAPPGAQSRIALYSQRLLMDEG